MSEFLAEALPFRSLHEDASQWARDGSYCLSPHPFDIAAIEPAFDWSTADLGMAFGSQWKTRGGWRAMVVEMLSDEMNVLHWHDHDGRAHAVTPHFKTGKSWTAFESDHDLIDPWVEPIKGACWVNSKAGGQLGGAYTRKDQADEAGNHGQRIARVKVSYTQGQFDK